MEYVGSSTVLAGKAVWFTLFLVVFLIQLRMNVYSYQRLKAKKKSYWDKTSNEWLSFYMVFILFIRLVQELDYEGAGFIGYKLSFVITKVFSGTLFCCLYTISWGWHKVSTRVTRNC
jgi:hypothetical protein